MAWLWEFVCITFLKLYSLRLQPYNAEPACAEFTPFPISPHAFQRLKITILPNSSPGLGTWKLICNFLYFATLHQCFCTHRLETGQRATLSSYRTQWQNCAVSVTPPAVRDRGVLNHTHFVHPTKHLSSGPALHPTHLHLSKMPPQAGRRCILSLIPQTQPRRWLEHEQRWLCVAEHSVSVGLGPPAAPTTERLALPCCYGRHHWVALLDSVCVPVKVRNILSPHLANF